MVVASSLKTLGDYRQLAQKTLFSHNLGLIDADGKIVGGPVSDSTHICDAIDVAMFNIKMLLAPLRSSRTYVEGQPFKSNMVAANHLFPGKPYEIVSYQLYRCIKLMEFAVYYTPERIQETLKDWPQRPNMAINVFNTPGLSYLEATYRIIKGCGLDVATCLPNVSGCKRRKTLDNNCFANDLDFLDQTPEINNVKFLPEPDPILKTWFLRFMDTLQERFTEDKYSLFDINGEINTICYQLKYELGLVQRQKDNPFKNFDRYLTVPEIIHVLEIKPQSQKHKNLSSDLSKLKNEPNVRIKIEPTPRKQTDPRYRYDCQNQKFLDAIQKYKS